MRPAASLAPRLYTATARSTLWRVRKLISLGYSAKRISELTDATEQEAEIVKLAGDF